MTHQPNYHMYTHTHIRIQISSWTYYRFNYDEPNEEESGETRVLDGEKFSNYKGGPLNLTKRPIVG